MIYSCVSIFSFIVDKLPKLAQLNILSLGVALSSAPGTGGQSSFSPLVSLVSVI